MMFTQTKLTILNDFFLLTLHTWRMYVIYSDHLLVDRSKDHRLCSKPAHYDSFQQREINCLEGLPWWLSGKESTCQCKRHRLNPWIRTIPWRRKWQPTPVFLPEQSQGLRILVGYSPQGCNRVRHDWATKQQQRIIRNSGQVLLLDSFAALDLRSLSFLIHKMRMMLPSFWGCYDGWGSWTHSVNIDSSEEGN